MQNYKNHFSDSRFRNSFSIALFLLATSLFVQFYASNYATKSASGFVSDIVLSNTRVYDVDGLFVYGAIALFFIVLYICLKNPKYLIFTTKSIALFTFVRSFFITLTHIKSFPGRIPIDSIFLKDRIFNGIFSGDGLFFSGHTGLPFLLALIFWENKYLRYLFLTFSVGFGVVVLLGHIHYTIDVFSAYFITYSIYHVCLVLFNKDREIFNI